MSEAGCFFEVADGQFAGGVGSVMVVGVDDGLFSSRVDLGTLVAVILPDTSVGLVVTVRFDRHQVQVGNERVLPPVGPELRLVTDQAGAAHHQSDLEFLRPLLWIGHLKLCSGDLCFATPGIVDTDPGFLFDTGDPGFDPAVQPGRDRPAHTPLVESDQHCIRPKPRIGPHVYPAPSPRPSYTPDRLYGEMDHTPLRPPLPQTGTDHRAGVRPERQQRVITQFVGVTIGGAPLRVARHLPDRRDPNRWSPPSWGDRPPDATPDPTK